VTGDLEPRVRYPPIGAVVRSRLIKTGVVRIWTFCAWLIPCPDPG